MVVVVFGVVRVVVLCNYHDFCSNGCNSSICCCELLVLVIVAVLVVVIVEVIAVGDCSG